MHFVVYLLDKPESHALRESVRPSHLSFIRELGQVVKVGGPLLAHDAETKIGGMYVLEAEDLVAAEVVANADPYVTSGLAASVQVRPWRWQTDNR